MENGQVWEGPAEANDNLVEGLEHQVGDRPHAS